jgi:hypothetical protein
MTPQFLNRHILPAACDLVGRDTSTAATAAAARLLTAIALQESNLCTRRQVGGGPARSYWQFEMSGIAALLRSPEVSGGVAAVYHALDYTDPLNTYGLFVAVSYDTILAAACARLTLAAAAPGLLPNDRDLAWALYLRAWRPGAVTAGGPRADAARVRWYDSWNRAASGVGVGASDPAVRA